MEIFKRQKGEPMETLTARIIQERAKGRCEYEWHENHHSKKRCLELHGERAQSFKGVVQLIPMPVNGLLDTRVCSLKAYCQKHAYALLGEMQSAVRPSKRTKPDKDQISMFGAGI